MVSNHIGPYWRRAHANTNHLDARIQELIALAVTVTTRGDCFIAFHLTEAVEIGISKEEIHDDQQEMRDTRVCSVRHW